MKILKEWADLGGRELDIPAMQEYERKNTVTAEDRAIRNERILFDEIDKAYELGMLDRVDGLIEHAKWLKNSGEMIQDMQWRAATIKEFQKSRANAEYDTAVPDDELVRLVAMHVPLSNAGCDC